MLSVLLLVFLAGGVAGQSPGPGSFEPELSTTQPSAAAMPHSLRIACFNVHYGREPLKLAQSLRDNKELSQADILLIQEIENHAREGSSRAAQLAAVLGFNYVYAPARTTESGGTHGLAIFSRYPLRDIEVIQLPQYNLHFNTRSRIALAATVEVGETALRVYNLHLDTRLNPDERREQLRPALERARAQPLARVVVGGDFNTSPFRWLGHVFPVFRSNQANTLDQYMHAQGFETRFVRGGPTTTRRRFMPFRLDTLYTRGLQVRASGVAYTVAGSDHVPVWIEVAWP